MSGDIPGLTADILDDPDVVRIVGKTTIEEPSYTPPATSGGGNFSALPADEQNPRFYREIPYAQPGTESLKAFLVKHGINKTHAHIMLNGLIDEIGTMNMDKSQPVNAIHGKIERVGQKMRNAGYGLAPGGVTAFQLVLAAYRLMLTGNAHHDDYAFDILAKWGSARAVGRIMVIKSWLDGWDGTFWSSIKPVVQFTTPTDVPPVQDAGTTDPASVRWWPHPMPNQPQDLVKYLTWGRIPIAHHAAVVDAVEFIATEVEAMVGDFYNQFNAGVEKLSLELNKEFPSVMSNDVPCFVKTILFGRPNATVDEVEGLFKAVNQTQIKNRIQAIRTLLRIGGPQPAATLSASDIAKLAENADVVVAHPDPTPASYAVLHDKLQLPYAALQEVVTRIVEVCEKALLEPPSVNQYAALSGSFYPILNEIKSDERFKNCGTPISSLTTVDLFDLSRLALTGTTDYTIDLGTIVASYTQEELEQRFGKLLKAAKQVHDQNTGTFSVINQPPLDSASVVKAMKFIAAAYSVVSKARANNRYITSQTENTVDAMYVEFCLMEGLSDSEAESLRGLIRYMLCGDSQRKTTFARLLDLNQEIILRQIMRCWELRFQTHDNIIAYAAAATGELDAFPNSLPDSQPSDADDTVIFNALDDDSDVLKTDYRVDQD